MSPENFNLESSEETVHHAKNAKLIIIKNAPHDISHSEYIMAIKKELYKIAK
ncbi:MAG: hypothetical protein WCX74_01905 [Candidatus Paceibacterota bacterium]